jgi:hypothetical protein
MLTTAKLPTYFTSLGFIVLFTCGEVKSAYVAREFVTKFIFSFSKN